MSFPATPTRLNSGPIQCLLTCEDEEEEGRRREGVEEDSFDEWSLRIDDDEEALTGRDCFDGEEEDPTFERVPMLTLILSFLKVSSSSSS